LIGSLGWQQWSKFGRVQIGIEDTSNPTSTSEDLGFDDTWHGALGAQYRLSDPWLLNFSIAYDSGFQDSSEVSPLLLVNSACHFGVGVHHQKSATFSWGRSVAYIYGGMLDTELRGTAPVAIGGRGDVEGSYDNTEMLVFALYGSWKFNLIGFKTIHKRGGKRHENEFNVPSGCSRYCCSPVDRIACHGSADNRRGRKPGCHNND
jgi:long-chain fatty acid transport protein